MKTLAGAAMAVLRIQGFILAQLILYTSTMAAGLQNRLEVVILMNPVRNTHFPLVNVLVAVAVTLRSGHRSGDDWLAVSKNN